MTATVSMALRYAGSCQHPEGMVLTGAPWAPATFPAMYAVLVHPTEGVTLFDTGYAGQFLKETDPFPARLYRWLTPVALSDDTSAAAQLAQEGIDPRSVKRIILSHFHADHIAGARDFPNARFIATREAYDTVNVPTRFGKLLKGFLPGLLPDDFEARAELLPLSDFRGPSVGTLPSGFDLFGDGSVVLVPLPGHAAGQVGAMVKSDGGGRHFLVADAAWTSTSFREDRPSHPLAGLIMKSPSVAAETLRALHTLAKNDPGLDIIPSHCRQRAAVEARAFSDGYHLTPRPPLPKGRGGVDP